jgi:hypothetical protein
MKNNSNSGYSNHILNTGQKYGTITDIIYTIRTLRKGKHLNTLEKYYIYIARRDNVQMKYTSTDTHKPIIKTLHETNNS